MNATRRGMMTAAGAAAAMVAVAPKAFAAWEPNERYPDPAIQTLDPAFNKYRHRANHRREDRRRLPLE